MNFEKDKSIGELFEQKVKERPNDIAVVFDENRLTYLELNHRVNSLARALKEKEITEGSIVGIYIHRSLNMITGILAALKIGVAYLPIDPSYPIDRVEYMIENSGTKMILVSNDLIKKLPESFQIINVDDSNLYTKDNSNLGLQINNRNVAYVIYTSGSTGKPKGVMIEHRQVVNFSKAMKEALDLDKYKSILCMTTVSFDIFVNETIVPLLNGMKVVITKEGEDIDGEIIADKIISNKIDIIQSTPSRLKILFDNKKFNESFNRLKVILSGGEQLRKDIVSKILQYKNVSLYNMYGPTETTVWSLVDEVKSDERILIGKPIGNTELYIISRDNELLPTGCIGELCISGEGVARGYLNREDLTKEKFIMNPYSKEKRLYKTGDLARWNLDGRVECYGRIDNQVKIRGYRIELEEIENILLKIKGIRQVKVVAKEKDGVMYLYAYYVSEIKYSISEIREKLLKKLPEYMVPSYFIRLEKIPLTLNGKLNDLELKKIEMSECHEFVLPENEIQRFLVEELSKILSIKDIGINDNIFEFGANSLNVMRFIQRIRVKYNVDYTDIVRNPTIKEISKVIKPQRQSILTKLKEVSGGYKDISKEERDQINEELSSYRKKYLNEFSKIDLNKIKEYKRILLTGATGYLGNYLLKGLLENTSSQICLIIRGKTLDDAIEKVKRSFKFYFNNELNEYKERIVVYQGDISKDKLGLSFDEYQYISMNVDCIINSAANVSHYGLYEDFYSNNVTSVENMLKLCTSGINKDFNQISTTSVASGKLDDYKYKLYTEYDCFETNGNENNYIKTKKKAESLILSYRDKGVNSTIFRVGNIVFNSENGQCQRNIDSNAFYQRIKSILKLRNISDGFIDSIEFSFIEQVSKAIILLFNRELSENQIFHICNGNRINREVFINCINSFNLKMNIIKDEEFIQFLIDNYDNDELREVIDILLIHLGILDENSQTIFKLLSEKTEHILKRLNFTWHEIDRDHIKKMLSYAFKIGFFNDEEKKNGTGTVVSNFESSGSL
ncbi:amino acid adenylation domain-containing protein [Clostridium beijerinckii]|nr:amino acid adenylation domain-containing protein [Clostridium beijerinckii]NRY40999.1 amino acid adenylation domain-containing protein/thioester reductase-like protein [Clostridium beijerinckii]NRY65978.1 amino acid adenylation domain-containing protein/thioester reductase-like protein [Clostridium beijerinckii]